LAQLAGAQPDLLRQAPADKTRHSAMGGVLLTTATVAGVSAAFALNTAVGLDPVSSVVVGALWGWVIFNLDRMLVISMGRHGGWLRNLFTALPRVALAVVIGFVISAPLVLRIFQPEIGSELEVMRNERFVESQTQIGERFAQIPVLEQREVELQGTVSGQVRPSVAADPEVERLQTAFDAKNAEYQTAEQNVVCENDGTCGSGAVGRGPSYREKVEIRDRLRGERDDLRAELDRAIGDAQTRLETGAQSQVAAAQAELTRVRGELAELRAEKAAEEARVAGAEENSQGLLARLEALDRLTAQGGTMLAAHLALALLFIFIELLPVLVKLLALFGEETHYEQLVAAQEADLKQSYDDKLAVFRRSAKLREDAIMDIDKHRATAQVAAGKAANDLLVVKQTEIAEKAVDVWAQVAMARSDDELARWYAAHTGQPPPAAGTTTRQASGNANSNLNAQTQPIPVTVLAQTVPLGVPVGGPAPGSYHQFKAQVNGSGAQQTGPAGNGHSDSTAGP
jgi:hypothetical protein